MAMVDSLFAARVSREGLNECVHSCERRQRLAASRIFLHTRTQALTHRSTFLDGTFEREACKTDRNKEALAAGRFQSTPAALLLLLRRSSRQRFSSCRFNRLVSSRSTRYSVSACRILESMLLRPSVKHIESYSNLRVDLDARFFFRQNPMMRGCQ